VPAAVLPECCEAIAKSSGLGSLAHDGTLHNACMRALAACVCRAPGKEAALCVAAVAEQSETRLAGKGKAALGSW